MHLLPLDILFWGCPSICVWLKLVNMISYKLLEGILPHYNFWCSWGQRWIG